MSIKINDKNLSKMYIGTPITDATKIQMSSTDSKTVAEAINENKENVTQINKSLSWETDRRTDADEALSTRITSEEQIRSQTDMNLQNQIKTNKSAENVYITETTRNLYGISSTDASVDKTLQRIKNIQKDLTVLASSGTYTVPAGVNVIDVFLCGGGGGGGGGSYGQAGGGGGGGECYFFPKIPVTPGQSFNVVVGAGGTAGNPGGFGSFSSYMASNGSDGGNTSFGYFTVYGGKGGYANGNGGNGNGGGGVGSSNASLPGANGGSSANFTGGGGSSDRNPGINTQKDYPTFYGRVFGGGGGGGGSHGGTTGGLGGNSNAGNGGAGSAYTPASPGANGTATTGGGAGGGGGVSNSNVSSALGGAGGTGGSGVVVIGYYA
ncbi:glycine-rich domain-containing protein [Aminipila terrae]|uniref:glycine-rich domain-containing protein n=1 Tax=Aminipila terrae TaxID=2697030 RepID=UPI00192FAEEF|nr:hypothetical protein [Aminipila terrae]